MRSVLAVLEEGSVNRAARRLGVAQPTLSRQIQSLEQEIGGPLFERGSWGMRPTDLCFYLRDRFKSLVVEYDLAKADVHAFALGRHWQVRVGYIGLAAARYLNPALAQLKKEFPDLKLLLFDQTPSDQLRGLRDGHIDVALVGQEVAAIADDFFKRRAVDLGACVALPIDHPMSQDDSIPLKALSKESFVGVSERAVPGRNNWILDTCAKAGYRPRIVAETNDVSETFTLVASERYVALLPDYLDGNPPPGTAVAKIADKRARWSLYVLRQRGRGLPAVRRLVEIIGSVSR